MAMLDASRLLRRPAGVPLAWRNLVASKRRLLRSSAGIAFATLLTMVQLGFERGFFDASLAGVRALDGDLIVTSAYKYNFASRDPFPHSELERVRKVAGIASAAPFYASWQDLFWTSPIDGKPYLVRVFAFDPGGPPVLSLPEVIDQQALLKNEDAVLVDRAARSFLGMDGNASQTDIAGKPVKIAGSFTLGPDFMSDGTVVMSDRLFARLIPGHHESAATLPIEAIIIKVKPGETVSTVRDALDKAVPDTLSVVTKAELVDTDEKFQADLSSAGPIFWLGTVVGFVVGMLISYQIIYTDLIEQLPQYATLKAIGYKTPYLVRSVLKQAVLSAIAGYIPAWLLCIVTYRVIGALALLPLHMTLGLTMLTLGLTLGMCLLAGALAVRPIISVDPAEIF